MHVEYGYVVEIITLEPTVGVVRLDIHPSHRSEITKSDKLVALALADNAVIGIEDYKLDQFQNIRRNVPIPSGGIRLEAIGAVYQSGFVEQSFAHSKLASIAELPSEVHIFLSSSRLCDLEGLATIAKLDGLNAGDCEGAVAEILSFMQRTVRTVSSADGIGRTASQTLLERLGTDQDLAHLAIGLCRLRGLPARYCSGYLCLHGRNETTFLQNWFEVYFAEQWWPFDASPSVPAVGRLPISIGRDASDCAVIEIEGNPVAYEGRFFTEEVSGERFPMTSLQRREHWHRNPKR